MPPAKELLKSTLSAAFSFGLDAVAGPTLRAALLQVAAAALPAAVVPAAAAIGTAGAIGAVASTAAAAFFSGSAAQTVVVNNETPRGVTETDDGFLEIEDEKKPEPKPK